MFRMAAILPMWFIVPTSTGYTVLYQHGLRRTIGKYHKNLWGTWVPKSPRLRGYYPRPSLSVLLHKGVHSFLANRPAHSEQIDLLHAIAKMTAPRPGTSSISESVSTFKIKQVSSWVKAKCLMESVHYMHFQIRYKHQKLLVKAANTHLFSPDIESAVVLAGVFPTHSLRYRPVRFNPTQKSTHLTRIQSTLQSRWSRKALSKRFSIALSRGPWRTEALVSTLNFGSCCPRNSHGGIHHTFQYLKSLCWRWCYGRNGWAHGYGHQTRDRTVAQGWQQQQHQSLEWLLLVTAGPLVSFLFHDNNRSRLLNLSIRLQCHPGKVVSKHGSSLVGIRVSYRSTSESRSISKIMSRVSTDKLFYKFGVPSYEGGRKPMLRLWSRD